MPKVSKSRRYSRKATPPITSIPKRKVGRPPKIPPFTRERLETFYSTTLEPLLSKFLKDLGFSER